jgi:hypothetical protein
MVIAEISHEGPELLRSGPISCPYAAECVEVEFLELRLEGFRRFDHLAVSPASSGMLLSLVRNRGGNLTPFVPHGAEGRGKG